MESDIPHYILEKYPRACPREGCGSRDVKFRYFNNRFEPKVGFTQPRYLCNGCRKLFTRGGTQYKKKSQEIPNPNREAVVRTTQSAPTGNQRMDERTGAAAPGAAATARAAATGTATARRPGSNRPRKLVLLSSSSSSEADSEEEDEYMPDQETCVEASSAEEGEASVQAAEFEDEPMNNEINSEGEAGGEPDEETVPPEETAIASEEETPAPSMYAHGRRNVDFGPSHGVAKALVVEKTKKYLLDAELVLLEIKMEKEALKADHIYRVHDMLSRLMNRELSADEEGAKTVRDKYVAAIRSVKAESGRVYEYSLEMYNQVREREDAVTEVEEAIETLRFEVENTDIDHARHSDLVKIERKALRLRDRAHRLNEY